jgi:predicted metallopeptidase
MKEFTATYLAGPGHPGGVEVEPQVAQTLPVVAKQAVRRRPVVVEKQVARRPPEAVRVAARRLVAMEFAARKLVVVELAARRLVVVGLAARMVVVAAAVAHIPRRFAEAVRRWAVVEVVVAGVVFGSTARRRFGYMAVEF